MNKTQGKSESENLSFETKHSLDFKSLMQQNFEDWVIIKKECFDLKEEK